MPNSFLSARLPAAEPLTQPTIKSLNKPVVVATTERSATVAAPSIGIILSAALMTVRGQQPWVLLVEPDAASSPMLPAGLLSPSLHRSLDAGVRSLVAAQVGIELGYSEQLYTFGEPGRVTTGTAPTGDRPHVLSIGYLALLAATHEAAAGPGAGRPATRWVKCYDLLPWEDWRQGRPALLDDLIGPQLNDWAACPLQPPQVEPNGLVGGQIQSRQDRIDLAFGLNGAAWNEELALERHELLYEAGLLGEAQRDCVDEPPLVRAKQAAVLQLGRPLGSDHRRMLAMALGRLRAKIKYRPIVFELMPDTFTLFELQGVVQAILGTPLHKQNFRRLVENTGLVEDVGTIRVKTGGRPAKLFRFRPGVVMEQSAPGVRVKGPRT